MHSRQELYSAAAGPSHKRDGERAIPPVATEKAVGVVQTLADQKTIDLLNQARASEATDFSKTGIAAVRRAVDDRRRAMMHDGMHRGR